MITSLTPEQVVALDESQKRWLDKFFGYKLYQKNNLADTTTAMEDLYAFVGLEKPIVLLEASPYACKMRAKELAKNEEIDTSFSNYINYSDFGWLSNIEYYIDHVDIVIEKADEIKKIINWVENSFMSIQFDTHCIVSKYPCRISRNAANELHCVTGHAIEFEDGYGQHYVNGRFVSPELFTCTESIEKAKASFFELSNEDDKAAIVSIIKERFGNAGLMEMLDAECVDEKTLIHEGGYTETQRLLKTRNTFAFASDSKGKTPAKLAWNEMVCPSTGSVYLIETCPLFNDVTESAKWLRGAQVPDSVPYVWQSAN